jgi:hypothetical protein
MSTLTSPPGTFTAAVQRLSRASVDRHFDAYADIDWNSPDFDLDPTDPRLELPAWDPLGATDWYRAQPADVRARIGLYRYAACMKIGWHFENVLQRGLLKYAAALPNGQPEFRYVHHELIEESQHTLMFQEFVNRSDLPVRGMPRPLLLFAQLFVVPLSRRFPPSFFLFVLGGEDPPDYLQRRYLRDHPDGHPLIRRIMQIHVTEEARHLSFARELLQRDVSRLGVVGRARLSVTAPIVLGVMTRLMLYPPSDLIRYFDVPRSVARSAKRSPQGRRMLRDSLSKTRRLWTELGLITPLTGWLWQIAGIGGGHEPEVGSATRR